MATNANGFWDPMAPAPKDPFAMTPGEHTALLLAPKRTGGTTATSRASPSTGGTNVTVRAYDIPGLHGKQHMYVQYDDGRERLIARGGPSGQGAELFGQGLDDSLTVTAGVVPAMLSRDFGRGKRVVDSGFLPGVSAQAAAAPARRLAREVNRDGRRYSYAANSNSYAADVGQATLGRRPGDALTPGYSQPLKVAPRARPLDLSPLLTAPLY